MIAYTKQDEPFPSRNGLIDAIQILDTARIEVGCIQRPAKYRMLCHAQTGLANQLREFIHPSMIIAAAVNYQKKLWVGAVRIW